MVSVEPPKVSGIQPMGVLGEAVMAYFRMPPYLSPVGAGGVVTEVVVVTGLEVVIMGAVVFTLVVVGAEVVVA